MALENEAKIIADISTGNEDAFRQVFDEYRKRIYSYALRLTRSETLANETVQDVFLKVWLNRGKLPAVKNFNAWTHTICRNHLVSAMEKIAREKTALKDFTNMTPGFHNNVDAALLDKDNERLIEEALELLSPQQQVVFTLSRTEGLNKAEIAAQLNISPNTVKAHLYEAMLTIKAYLSKEVNQKTLLLLVLLYIFSAFLKKIPVFI